MSDYTELLAALQPHRARLEERAAAVLRATAIDNRGIYTSARRAPAAAPRLCGLWFEFMQNPAERTPLKTLALELVKNGLAYSSAARALQALSQTAWEFIGGPLKDALFAAYSEFSNAFLIQLAFEREVQISREQEQSQLALQRALQKAVSDGMAALDEARTFRQFAQASGQGISISNLQGKITYANPALLRMLGQDDLAALVGQPLTTCYPPELQDAVQDILAQVIAQGQWVGELALITPDGRRRPTQENIFIIRDEQAQPRFLADLVTDMTESKKAQADLQDTLREVERAYQAMSREGWESFRQAAALPEGYRVDQDQVQPSGPVWMPELGQAVRQGKLVTSPPDAPQPVSIAPLAVRGQVIGAVGVYDDPAQPLAPEELIFLEQLAEQGAQALEAARLFEQTQSALGESQALYQASAALNAAQTLEQVLQILRDHSFLKQADRQVSINVFDSPWVGEQMPQKIECLATWNSISARRAKPVQRKSAFVPLATSASYLLKPGTPVIIQDMATDERVDNKLRAFYLRWLNARSAIYIPLTAAGQFIGYIEAVYREPAMPSEADVRRLMNITGQAAVAVQSIRQFEETRVRAHREQVLREIAATISASQDFLAVSLSDIGWYMHELLPVDTLTVATVRPDDKEYSLYASSPDIDADTLPTQCIRHPLKDSVIGWVVKNGQPRLDKDIRQEQNFVEDARHAAAGWAARLVVPLSTAGQIVGTLNLFNAQPGAFTGEQFELVQPIAEQMAIALERARLLEETRTALAEVEATQRRYLRTQWENYLASAVERATGYLDGPTGLVPISPVQAGSATGELISVPLKVRGEPIGVMEFYSESAERAWTDEERALVETLADQAALALENARLFEDTQSRAQREHLIGEITGKIRASMDMETILRTTTEELARTLNLSRARVRLGPGRTESAE